MNDSAALLKMECEPESFETVYVNENFRAGTEFLDEKTKTDTIETVKGVSINSARDLRGFLSASPTGRVPLAQYTQFNFLNDSDRNKLADCIINNELCEDVAKKLTRPRLEFLAKCLSEVFPNEKTEAYYRVHKYPNGHTIGKGKLYSKYYNTRRCLMQVRLVEAHPEKTVDGPVEDSNLDPESSSEAMTWLSNNSSPWERVLELWNKTAKTRLYYLRENNVKSFAEFMDLYPALKDPFGFTLFELDFNKRYPAATNKLFSEWPKLLKFISSKMAEKEILLLRGDKTEAEQTVVALQNFCRIFPVITTFRKSSINQWRPSRKECEDAFFLLLKNFDDIEPYLVQRRKKLQKYDLTPQPQVVVIGGPRMPNWCSEVKCYVVGENLLYEVGSPLKALDVTFKMYLAIDANGQYPPEAKQMWEFLQRAVYNIKTKNDNFTSSVLRLVDEFHSKCN